MAVNRGHAQASPAFVQKASVIDVIIEKVTPAAPIASVASYWARRNEKFQVLGWTGKGDGCQAQPSDHHVLFVDLELG
jgi:hypothetical protein